MKKLLIFGGLAIALVGLPFISKLNQGDSSEAVELSTAERKPVRSSILSSGTLAFREQVQLRSEVIAQVTGVHVEEADEVSKGDLVISLDTESYDAQVEQARALVRIQEIAIERSELAVADLERQHRNQSELIEANLVDQDSYDRLLNLLDLARVDLRSQQESLLQTKAALAQAEDLLTKTQITSPIDGIVIQVDVKAGETVIAGTTNIPGSTLMVIADPSEMLAEVRVDEADIAQVREGQAVDIFAAAFPYTPLKGTVESIATTARQAPGQVSLTFLVKILLDDKDELEVRSGMSARADIYTQSSEDTLAVPIQAVRYDDEADEGEEGEEEQAFVFIYEDGVARRKDVTTGISSDSDQEILAGLSGGERVISGPFRVLRHLDDGDPVSEESSSDEDETDDDSDD